MGIEYRTPAYGALLAAHDERAVPWSAETTATAAGRLPGVLASAVSALVLGCSGEPTLASGTQVRAQRSGYPDAGASLAYQTSGGSWIGWDAPTSVTYVEEVQWTSGLSPGLDAHMTAAALPDGRVVLVSEDEVLSDVLRVRVRTAAGVWSAFGIIAYVGAAARPVVVQHDQHVRIYTIQRGAADFPFAIVTREAAQSSTLTTGASWQVIARSGITISSAPTSMQVVQGGGQWMAVIAWGSTPTLTQYASRDGLDWRLVGFVESGTAVTHHALSYSGGAFVLVYTEEDGGDYLTVSRSVGSAYTSFSTATKVTVFDQGAGHIVDDYASFVDDAGLIWLLGSGRGTYRNAKVWCTLDGGATWRSTGEADLDDTGRWWGQRHTFSADTTTIGNMAPVWWRDRALVMMQAGADLNEVPSSLVAVHLGGRTSHALPESTQGWRAIDRFSWPLQWWPALPIPTVWLTIVGSHNRLMGTAEPGVNMQITTQAGASIAISPGVGTLSESAGRAVLRVEAGQAQQRVKATDGTDYVEVEVRYTPTGFTVRDNVASTTLETVTTSEPVDVVLWVSASGKWRVWWREYDDGVRDYAELTGDGLTSDTGTDSGWLVSLNESGEMYVWLLQTLDYVGGVNRRDTGYTSVASDWSAATAPGRLVGVEPVYLASDLRVSASAGPARAGDTWTYTPDWQYAAASASWTEGLLASPRHLWRSTVATTEWIAWKLADAATSTLSPIWALVYQGDAQRISLAWHDGTSWGASTHLDVGLNRTCTLVGDTLVMSGAAEVGAFCQEDELAGGFVVDTGGRARRILRNTAGVLGAVTGLTQRSARIVIEVLGSETTGSATWKVIPPRVVYLVAPPATAKGFRVGFGVSAGFGDLPGGVHTGKVLLGPAYLLGKPHGVDSTREYRAPRREFVGESGIRLYGASAPAEQVVTLTWQSSLDKLGQARGTRIGGPDYMRAWTGSGDPAYSRGEGESTIRALVERWSATGRAVAYVPMYDRAAGDQALRLQRQAGVVVGTLDPTWLVEHVGPQQEQVSDVVRLGALTIRELT